MVLKFGCPDCSGEACGGTAVSESHFYCIAMQNEVNSLGVYSVLSDGGEHCAELCLSGLLTQQHPKSNTSSAEGKTTSLGVILLYFNVIFIKEWSAQR